VERPVTEQAATKLWVLYDERANIDEDDAAVLCTAYSLDEAREDRRTMFPTAVIFEYDLEGDTLVNGRRIPLGS
jgi:hypothetical protein